MIAVTFALPAESSGFLRLVHNKTRSDRNSITTVVGKIDNPENIGAREPFRSRAIEIFHTGVGEKVCRKRMARFLQDRQLDCLISAGFAGALNDQLNVGDLLLAQNFSTAELSNARSLLVNLPIHIGNLLTAPSMIDSNEERNKIARATGAAAVDMEMEFIARACAEHGVPLLSLRVISDTPTKPLPAPPNVLFDLDEQKTNFGRLAFYLAKNPPAIWRLISFARQIGRARERLSNAIVTLVRELHP
jgi:adenosylhomocysteine nucleosidase